MTNLARFDADIIGALRNRIANNGLRATARELSLSAPFVSDLEKGRRKLTEAVANKLGFELVWAPPAPPRVWRIVETSKKPGGKK